MKGKAIKARIFNAVQFEVNPKTGESLHFSEANIKACVAHKSITNYAYIRHDKDVYTKDDEKSGHKAGTPKPPHYHIIMKCENAIELGTVAQWLNIPPQYIEIPKGRGAFLDCVQYLTHESEKEQLLGKYLYSDSDITANFDFRAELNKRETDKIKYGSDLNEKNQMRYDVLYLGKTLYDCRKSNPILYLDDCMVLEKLRHRYLTEVAQIPPLRINFYIYGDGGIGKNTASKILAKSLFPDMEKPYFEVGASGVAFQNYDGEPVLIWNDTRASNFITDFGRAGTFDMLDIHPTDSAQNIKYGSTRLINQFNIINGVEPHKEFLDGLAGEYTDKNGKFHKAEDKSQSFRRIPIILYLREGYFDCLINKGVATGTREYEQYIEYKNMIGSFAKIAQKLEGQAQLVVAKNMLDVVLDGVEMIKVNESKKISNIDDIPEEFKSYGDMLPF